MAATPTYGLRYQGLSDPPHGPNLGQNLAEDVEDELERIDAAVAAVAPACRAYNNTGEAPSNGVLTLIRLQAESWKTVGSMHSTSSNTSRVIAPVSGVYSVQAGISYGANATGRRVLQLRVNAAGVGGSGTQLHSFNLPSAATSGCGFGLADDIPLVANDYVEMFGLQLSGGAVGIDAGEYSAYLGLRLVRPL